jgi:hypothetical protein
VVAVAAAALAAPPRARSRRRHDLPEDDPRGKYDRSLQEGDKGAVKTQEGWQSLAEGPAGGGGGGGGGGQGMSGRLWPGRYRTKVPAEEARIWPVVKERRKKLTPGSGR